MSITQWLQSSFCSEDLVTHLNDKWTLLVILIPHMGTGHWRATSALCSTGLSMTWSVSTGTFLIIAFSYIRILYASLRQGRADSSIRSKAFQTCASHLVVYVLYEIASLTIIVSYRFPSLSQNIKKFLSILYIIVPPAINPIIYGLASRDLRTSIIRHFTKQWNHRNWWTH